jgi:hypothetical protein
MSVISLAAIELSSNGAYTTGIEIVTLLRDCNYFEKIPRWVILTLLQLQSPASLCEQLLVRMGFYLVHPALRIIMARTAAPSHMFPSRTPFQDTAASI